MSTTEKILQTMNSWQSGEVIAVRRKKCSRASSHPNEEYVKNYLEIRGKEMPFVNQIHNNI